MINDRQPAYVARLKREGFVQISGWVKAEHADVMKRWMRIAGDREDGELPTVQAGQKWLILIFDHPPPRTERELLKALGMSVLDGARNLWGGQPDAANGAQVNQIATTHKGKIFELR